MNRPLLKVMVVHNRYQQPGGEDQVFTSEADLLEANGHQVIRYEEDNARVVAWGAGAALNAIWSTKSARAIRDIMRRFMPGVVHFHNTFPLISPAAYYAVQGAGVPVVQTIHNFRLMCPGATLYRDGEPCERCIERKSLWPAIHHRCYRGSRPATAATAAMVLLHRAAQTWQRKVDVYVAPSDFVRTKLVQAGLPEPRILVKPNFVSPDPGMRNRLGDHALFVGRLSEEKGVATLRDAWQSLAGIPLKVIGDGAMSTVQWPQGASRAGRLPRSDTLAAMREARVLVVPSMCYEAGPLTVLEAFACGLPVIASNMGSMAETVRDGRTGLLFRPGDAADLAEKVRWAYSHPVEMEAMGLAARREYEEKYSAEPNYELLVSIYETAIRTRRREMRAAS